MQIRYFWEFNKALEHGPYAWPGGYPCYFICSDGGALSFQAAQENAGLIRDAIIAGDNSGWRVVAMDVNWEDPALYCDHSGARIQSAYAEDEANESGDATS
jgi:hypothetical protein